MITNQCVGNFENSKIVHISAQTSMTKIGGQHNAIVDLVLYILKNVYQPHHLHRVLETLHALCLLCAIFHYIPLLLETVYHMFCR